MRIIIKTTLQTDFKTVINNFDINLFKALKPPLLPLKVLRFDGSKANDEVHLDLGFGQKWISTIKESSATATEWYFIDQGKLLPKPLKEWQHLHKVIALENNQTQIADDIQYQTYHILLDYMIYPFLYLQFLWRIPAYKKYFKRLPSHST